MRYLFAVALIVHLGGAPVAWAKPCTGALERGEHPCCLQQRAAPASHLTGTCGCQLTPAPSAPASSSVAILTDGVHDAGMPLAAASGSLIPVTPPLTGPSRGAGPPGRAADSWVSLQASGFRC